MTVMTGFTSSADSPCFPTPQAFEQALGASLGHFGSIRWVNTTTSTNDELTQRVKLESAASMPWLVGAHAQTRGKGRAGRPWQNTAGETLMFSCAFDPKIPLAQLPGLAPALGVATCLALRRLLEPLLGQAACQKLVLKWPNDLQWGDAKLAGILLETSQQPGTRHPSIVAGIGINLLGARALSVRLKRAVIDLTEVLQQGPAQTGLSPPTLVAAIARAWHEALPVYAAAGYAAFQEQFNLVDALSARSVQVIDQGRVLHTGIAQGTDAIGRLLVLSAHRIIPILVGDVSIHSHPESGPAAKPKGPP